MIDCYIFDLKQYSEDEILKQSILIFTENENATVIVLNNNEFVTRINYEKCLQFLHILQSDKKISDDNFSYNCILNNNRFLSATKNPNYKKKYNYVMTRNRWISLYKDNSYLIEYLRKNLIKKILVTGEYALDVYYYIKKYGTDIQVVLINNDDFLQIRNDYNGWYVIDTNNMSSKIRENLIGNNYYNKLLDICDLIEIEKFRQFYLNRYRENFIFVEVPTTDKDLQLTHEEKERMMLGRNYKSFLQDTTPEIVAFNKKFFGNHYSQAMIRDICFPATILEVNGLLSQQSFANENFHVINGKRITPDNIPKAIKNVNFYGNCIVFGQMVDDFHTIPSYFQRQLNDNNMKINAINHGIRSGNLIEIIRNINYKGICPSDLNMIFYVDTEYELIEKLGIKNVYHLYEAFNDENLQDYFLDVPIHCNHIANSKISKYLFEITKEKLKQPSVSFDEFVCPMYEKNLYEGNRYVSEYIEFLKEYSKDGVNGGIVMNCNPFTNGHLNLIKYALRYVDILYVFVIQEDRSVFKFEDRLRMAKESCSDLKNVVVLPSGEFLGSAMLFPEYGSKDDSKVSKIDCLDDTEFFCKVVAPLLNIKYRFVGEENNDMITKHLNEELKTELPKYGISLIERPRFESKNGILYSARYIRNLILNNKIEQISDFVPQATLQIIFEGDYINKIQNHENVSMKKSKIIRR